MKTIIIIMYVKGTRTQKNPDSRLPLKVIRAGLGFSQLTTDWLGNHGHILYPFVVSDSQL